MRRQNHILESNEISAADTKERCLLIIACSRRKTPGRPRPAIQVYDGPLYRALRKRRTHFDVAQIQIFVISSKYGFISAQTVIDSYEQKITRERAKQLNTEVLEGLRRVVADRGCSRMYINLGKLYAPTISGVEHILPHGAVIEYASGGIGMRTSQTIKWIETAASRNSDGRESVRMRGAANSDVQGNRS